MPAARVCWDGECCLQLSVIVLGSGWLMALPLGAGRVSFLLKLKPPLPVMHPGADWVTPNEGEL